MNYRSKSVIHLACASLAFLSVSGCGLSEYERRIDAQRARIDKFDALNKSLDDPIDTPTIQITKTQDPAKDGPKDAPKDVPKDAPKEDVKAWPDELFLRLPKGYSTTPRDKESYHARLPVFRYSTGDPEFSILVAAALIQEPRQANEFGRYPPQSFRAFAREALIKFLNPPKNEPVAFPEKVKYLSRAFVAFSAYPDEEASVKYEYTQYTDKNRKHTFDVYFHEKHGRQVCIAFHRAGWPADKVAYDKMVEACLGTLDVSTDAPRKRAQFKKTKNP